MKKNQKIVICEDNFAITDKKFHDIESDESLVNFYDLLNAFAAYLKQTNHSLHESAIETFIANPYISNLIIDLFIAKFNPNHKKDEDMGENEIESLIAMRVNSLSKDEGDVFAVVINIIRSVVRTGFFASLNKKSYFAFKIDCKKVMHLEAPIPFAELFVFSKDFEGVHLRSGAVARGGLRLSDRRDDYRTEALSLMHAQTKKNSIIVPTGAKGCLFIKKEDATFEEKVEFYKCFLRSMLDVTDNIIAGKIVKPDNVVCHDADDPYFVVAADKGTGSFSDYANGVSAEYNFWLGDAFASGGSNGYSHKKIGITSAGAWCSIDRHFKELGRNVHNLVAPKGKKAPQTNNTDYGFIYTNCTYPDNVNAKVKQEPFSVIGIGDMTGDLFGNGMIFSKNTQLLAAFNHKHIFVDPNPNLGESFNERLRLFLSAGQSEWEFYDRTKISAGGGIFARFDKDGKSEGETIHITEEMRKSLGFDENVKSLKPSEFIVCMLKSKVDLLFNAGIGTFIKAKTESHADARDSFDDSIRINGEEVGAKIVSEGGNLGCTQRGRIEYAMNGGMINIDGIDNSAGVDCSDHEVNLKIALFVALEKGEISVEERNKLLHAVEGQISSLSIKDNYLQTQAISIAIRKYNVERCFELEDFLSYMEGKRILSRKLEALPTTEEIDDRIASDLSFTRPEISVMLSFSKIDLFKEFMDHKVFDADGVSEYLFSYFPDEISGRFGKSLPSHPLKNEIICTQIVNEIINRLGLTFIYEVISSVKVECSTTKMNCDVEYKKISEAYLFCKNKLNLNKVWHALDMLYGEISVELQYDICDAISVAMSHEVFKKLNLKKYSNSGEVVKNVSQKEIVKKIVSELKSACETPKCKLSEQGVANAKEIITNLNKYI